MNLEENGYIDIFLHLYKYKSIWKEYLMNHLEVFTNYRNQKLNEILRKVS